MCAGRDGNTAETQSHVDCSWRLQASPRHALPCDVRARLSSAPYTSRAQPYTFDLLAVAAPTAEGIGERTTIPTFSLGSYDAWRLVTGAGPLPPSPRAHAALWRLNQPAGAGFRALMPSAAPLLLLPSPPSPHSGHRLDDSAHRRDPPSQRVPDSRGSALWGRAGNRKPPTRADHGAREAWPRRLCLH